MKELKKKIIVVTGGTKGVGRALSEKLKAMGNTVIVLARHAENGVENFYECDVCEYPQVQETFSLIFEKYGKVDILVNNVGAGLGGAVEFLSADLLDWQIKVNLMGAVYCTKEVLRRTPTDAELKIINVSSIGAHGVQPFRTMYSTAKSALNTFTVGMRQELHGTPIKVCSVSLGDTRTDFGKNHPNDFTTSERYGDRIIHNDKMNADRAKAVKRDKRMPLEKSVAGLTKIVCKKKYRKATYFIGFKYKFLYVVSRFMTMDTVSEIVRKLFEN